MTIENEDQNGIHPSNPPLSGLNPEARAKRGFALLLRKLYQRYHPVPQKPEHVVQSPSALSPSHTDKVVTKVSLADR